MSGPAALQLASPLLRLSGPAPLSERKSHTLHHGRAVSPATGEAVDEVLVGLLRAPRSYTREDTVEIYCHGGSFILRRILSLLVDGGCRPARPGEFTQRAFLNGRIDLTRAEAVMDLIGAKSEAARRSAIAQLDGGLYRPISGLRRELIALLAEVEAGLDFVEEDIRFVSGEELTSRLKRVVRTIGALLATSASGRMTREGVRVAIVGNPNVGKSSLLNALLKTDRAIVSAHPGTTRDLIEDHVVLEGRHFHLVDTAGFRESEHPVEREGIQRAKRAIESADLILLVLDAAEAGRGKGVESRGEDWETELGEKRRLVIWNKIDLLERHELPPVGKDDISGIPVSALTGEGIEALKERLLRLVREGMIECGDREALINERHKEALLKTQRAINGALEAVKRDAPSEILAMELRNGADCLGEITGECTTESLLDRIFSRFCIGK